MILVSLWSSPLISPAYGGNLGGTTDCIVAWPWILLFATNHLILEAMVPAQNHRCSSLAGLGHHHLFEALAKSTHSSSRVPSVQSAYP